MYTDSEICRLQAKAVQVRANILDMIPPGKVGHLGGSMSIADVVAALYFHHMRVFDDPKNPQRDRLVFSKGHAVLAQYACLAELGYFSRDEFAHVKTLNGLLQGHPDMGTPGIEAVTGSLGQGLSVSLGMALALRLDNHPARVYCVLGDGEMAEGQVWEAAMAASAYGVDNLCAILDYNGIQATDTTDKVFPIPHVKEKWRAFGWATLEIDGHDMEAILKALDQARETQGQPTMIIAHTVKGKGIDFAENKAQFHNAAMDATQYRAAWACVERMREEIGQ